MLKQPEHLPDICLTRHFNGGFFVPFLVHDPEYSDVDHRSTQHSAFTNANRSLSAH